MDVSRRGFLALLASDSTARYRVGITTNTRGGWEKDVWLSFREAHEAGYGAVETFISYFAGEMNKPDEIRKRAEKIGVRFVTVSNSAPLEMHFEDPARREALLADHVRLARFVRGLGCEHLKINSGNRRPEGTTAEDLRNMAVTYNELGRRVKDAGLKLGIHAHMWSQFENGAEVDRILETTDPKMVWFVLDTGHVTMAGMDPLALTKRLGHRIIEFHLKDVEARHRGGAKQRVERNDPMKDPIFFELGSKGGVDFPGIKAELDRIGWRGWLTVELDSSPYRPPKECAVASRRYLEERLGIRT